MCEAKADAQLSLPSGARNGAERRNPEKPGGIFVESKNTDTPDVLPASRTRFSCLQSLCDEGAYFLFGGHNAERAFFFGYEGSCGVCKEEHGAQAFFCKIGKTV